MCTDVTLICILVPVEYVYDSCKLYSMADSEI